MRSSVTEMPLAENVPVPFLMSSKTSGNESVISHSERGTQLTNGPPAVTSDDEPPHSHSIRSRSWRFQSSGFSELVLARFPQFPRRSTGTANLA